MISKHLLRTLFLTLLVAAPVLAQETAPQPEADRSSTEQQELRQKALGLLEDVIKDSELFRHAENRLRIRAAAANILWDQDQARARLLFKEVMAGLADLFNNQQADDEAARPRMLEGPRQLRRELLGVLARRDARLARELLRSTRSEEPGARVPRGDVLADRPLELNLATQIAESDPSQALEIAEESLPGGLSYELPAVLSALHSKDPAAASRLASQIVVKLRTEKLGESEVARQVAVSVLRLAAQTSGDDGKAAKSAQPLLDPQAMSELIEKLAAEALRPNTTSPELVDVLQEVMPAVEKYAPARAAQLKRRAERPEGVGEVVQKIPTADPWNKYQSLLEKGTADEILAAAADAPEGMRDTFYQRAAYKVMEDGDAVRARQIINEHIQEPTQRRYMLNELNELATYAAARQGNLEQARKVIATLRTNEERVLALVQLAEGAAEKGDKKLTLALLDEAQELCSARAKNAKQLLAQLAVARAYGPLDASRSLAMLEPIVDQLNELLAAGVVLGSFFVEELVQDDEIMMEPLTSAANEIFNTYIGDFGTLARADFERTRGLADRFQRPEIRTIARLLVAQSVLMTPHAPPAKQSGSVIMGRIQ